MPTWRPDPTFYPSPALAMEAPAEGLAYVAMLNASGNGGRDAIGVVDVDPASPTYSRLVGKVEFPQGDNELHHFGWNACSSHLCPFAPHPHVERRYLVVPGTHSSRIHIVDTKPDPRNPTLVKVIEGSEVHAKTGYIDKARSLSGYVTTADGTMLSFSMLCNNYGVPTTTVNRVQDSLAVRLASLRLSAP